MKFVGILGSNSERSTNRLLLQYIQKHFAHRFELEILEISTWPIFDVSNDQTDHPGIQYVTKAIEAADGVIIATPEHIHTIPPCLKSALEWLSFKVHPLTDKPVYVVGASYHPQGSLRAQVHLKQVLEAPGISAYVFPGREFLLSASTDKFNEEGNLQEPKTVTFLEECLEKFIHYVKIINLINHPQLDQLLETLAPEETPVSEWQTDVNSSATKKEAALDVDTQSSATVKISKANKPAPEQEETDYPVDTVSSATVKLEK